MTRVPLAGIDWGTSSLRVFDLTSDPPRQLCDRPDGIRHFSGRDGYGDYLDRLLDDLGIQPATVVMSGMITSQQGWVETPYVPTPAALADLAAAALRRDVGDRAAWFLPGVSHSTDGGVDVMRGEETQIVGTQGIDAGSDDSGPEVTILLPGTHAKWAAVESGAIVGFATFVTGELYDLASRHSVIASVIDGDTYDTAAFDDGVDVGLVDPQRSGGLLRTLFSVRTRGLVDPSTRSGLASYLSGLLIGSEIAGAARWRTGEGPVLIVGQGALVDSYRWALDRAGIPAAAAATGAAGVGLRRIADHLGLR